ncbi:hypothetical protein ILUMI_18119, partial [Ignelater luminosus]
MTQTSNESESFELNADTYEVIKRSAAFKKLTIKRGQLRGELTQIDDMLLIHDESAFDHELAQSVRESFEDKFHEANGQANEIIHANAQGSVSKPAAVAIESNPTLQVPVKHWDRILIYLSVHKLDPYTKREWENHSKDMDAPTFDEFIKFLAQRCKILESSAKHFDARSNCTKKNDSKTFLCSNINNKPMQSPKHKDTPCPFCKSMHAIYHCEKFKNLSVKARYDEILRLKVCLNCLRFGHTNADCKSSGCKTCGKRHNTLLQRDSQKSAAFQTNSVEQISQINNHISLSQNLLHPRNRIYPLLPTALVNVYDQSNQPIVCKVLLDSGSQSHFVTYNLVKRLGLKLEPLNIPVSGINHIKTNINQMVNIDISSRSTNFKKNLTFLVVPSITEYIPFTHLNASGFNVPSGLPLADPNFYLSSAIDMLIGCDLFFELLLDGQIRLGKNMPSMQNTLLGWIVSGSISRVQNNNNSSVNAMLTSCLFTCETPIDFELQTFWAIEEIVPSRDTFLTKEELACGAHFAKTITRTSTGRFAVKLPLKPKYTQLGTTNEVAISRLLSMERKFLKDSNMKTEYTAFMSEYESLGHMTEVPCKKLRCNDDSKRLTDSMSSHDLQYTITDSTSIKTLGVSWIPSTDQFEYNAHNMHAYKNVKATKRSILSFIAKIFDPLGLLSPISIRAKLIIQKLWKLQLDWDDQIPVELQSEWAEFKQHVRVQYSNKTNENYTTPDDSTKTNYLTVNEVEAAEIALLKIAQIQAFPNKLCCLQRNQEVGPSSSLKSLAPSLDSSGIMRQQRTKWQFSHNADLAIGAIVLLEEDNIPPMHWRLGRITAVYPGKDGVVRVVSVRTKTGITKRALSK